MTAIVSTLDGPLGHAARLDAAEIRKLHPAVVDYWLIYPVTSCGCQQHQLTLLAHSLNMPGEQPVPPVLNYSHQISLSLLDTAPEGLWTPQQIITGHMPGQYIPGQELLTQPVILDHHADARNVAYSLVRDITVGALPAFPASSTETATWRLVITLALWRAQGSPVPSLEGRST